MDVRLATETQRAQENLILESPVPSVSLWLTASGAFGRCDMDTHGVKMLETDLTFYRKKT